MLTERLDPHPTGALAAHTVVCAEPSPDVALALSTTLSLQASAKTAATDASATAARNTSEAVSILAGRTATVIALRDGLFRACEAYANGVIGRDAYGLILSQYGDLLVTLMLGEDAAASRGAPAATPAVPAPAAAPAPGPGDPVVAIAKLYIEAAADRRRTAAFVLCTSAAEQERETGGTTHVDPTEPRCGGTTAMPTPLSALPPTPLQALTPAPTLPNRGAR